MAKRVKKPVQELKDFTLKNNLLTIKFWSQSFTTSLFDKHVKDYTLVCQYPLSNFNLDILKNIHAIQLYLDIDGKVYICRAKTFVASITAEAVILQLNLVNLRLKSAWDLEFSTPSSFYEQILSDKVFFKVNGKKLEEYVKPLGLLRKESETDQAFRRRTLSYLQAQMSEDDEVISDADIRELRGNDDGAMGSA